MLDFNLKQMLNLSNIKRWGIVEMSKEQSVAEHSYNVALISMALMEHVRMFDDLEHISQLDDIEFYALRWAILHDIPEVVTGDIPTTLKPFVNIKEAEEELFPLFAEKEFEMMGSLSMTIVKVADIIDAILFAKKYCIDDNKESIIYEMELKLHSLLSEQQAYPILKAVKLMELDVEIDRRLYENSEYNEDEIFW